MPYLQAAAHVLPMIILLGLGLLLVLTATGLGVTELLLPRTGLTLLIAPAVGLAVLELAFSWLTYVVPAVYVAVAAVGGGALLSAIVGYRRRSQLLSDMRDLVGAGVIVLGVYVALLQMVITRGFATLGGFPTDNIFIYVQAAQYLRDHVAPSRFASIALVNPGSIYLSGTGQAFPAPVGSIDAAFSVASGLPVYALFDPINALCLAITVGPVWFFVRKVLGASAWVALASAGTLGLSQLLYWVVGLGFQQESMALPMLTTGLAILCMALGEGGMPRSGVLLGLLGSAVVAVYLPIGVLLVICCSGTAAVAFACNPGRLKQLVRPVATAVATGAAASLAPFVTLAFGGFAVWASAVGVRSPAGGISQFPALPYIFGALPFAHTWGVNPQAYGRLERLALPVLVLASILMVVLLVAGQVRAALDHHVVAAAALTSGFVFIGYEAAVAGYPYGFVKSVGYMTPLAGAFIAYGATGLRVLVPPTLALRAQQAGVAALLVILASCAVASRDMIRVFVYRDPTLTAGYLGMSGLADAIPNGSTVFIDQPGAEYNDLVKAAALAYFLPDRAVRVYAGNFRIGTFYQQDERPFPCAFDYVVAADPPVGNFTMVYSDSQESLNLYRRNGAACVEAMTAASG